MLKSEYSHAKPTISQIDAKQHLHDIRYQRQNQLKSIINECHQLRVLHKRIFDNQLGSHPSRKPITSMPLRNESIFIVQPAAESEDELPISKEFTIYLTESSYTLLDYPSSNNQLAEPRLTFNPSNRSSVSSVSTADKQANKVYDKWPDYTEISQMVGYPSQKLPPISKVQRTTQPLNNRKQNKSNRFVDAIKQIQNRSSVQRNLLKAKSKNELPISDKLEVHPKSKESELKLPQLICPSSVYYSKRIRTRQWLCQNDFSNRILPLI